MHQTGVANYMTQC